MWSNANYRTRMEVFTCNAFSGDVLCVWRVQLEESRNSQRQRNLSPQNSKRFNKEKTFFFWLLLVSARRWTANVTGLSIKVVARGETMKRKRFLWIVIGKWKIIKCKIWKVSDDDDGAQDNEGETETDRKWVIQIATSKIKDNQALTRRRLGKKHFYAVSDCIDDFMTIVIGA